jgi:UTP-glucose-1-phosphate uridylyltransferase
MTDNDATTLIPALGVDYRMDTVILAAGKGERLNGITPSFFKPLLVVNRKPLVTAAADYGLRYGNVTVVASPDNAAAMTQVLPPNVKMILQRQALGPGHALQIGLQLVNTDNVLVLMGDNYFSQDDVEKVAVSRENGNIVGTEMIPYDDVERYTYLDDSHWVEKTAPMTRTDTYQAWVGPLRLRSHEIRKALEHSHADLRFEKDEMLIGPLFNILDDVRTVEVKTMDIGVPDAL